MTPNKGETTCPVCGFPDLPVPPWLSAKSASYEICPCCGIQFGKHDFEMDMSKRHQIHLNWRATWINQGMKFRHSADKPDPWDAVAQLRGIGVNIE